MCQGLPSTSVWQISVHRAFQSHQVTGLTILHPWVLMAKTKGNKPEQLPVKRRLHEKSPPDSSAGSSKVKPFYKDKRFQAKGPDKPSSDKCKSGSGTKERQVSSKDSKARADKTPTTTTQTSKSTTTRPSALKSSSATPPKQLVEDEEKKTKDRKKRDALKDKIDRLKELESDDDSERETLADMDAELNKILEGAEKDKKKDDSKESENEDSDSGEGGSGDEDEDLDEEGVSEDDSTNDSDTESGQEEEAKPDGPGTAIVPHEEPEEPVTTLQQRNSIFPWHS